MYLMLKHLHMTLALLTFISFFVRGIWMWRGSPCLQKKLVKILPHIIDTFLLITGVTVAVYLGFKPSEHPWLMSKMVALVVYIGLGVVAFKHRSPAVRKSAWIAALLVFIYIVSVAISKNPLPF